MYYVVYYVPWYWPFPTEIGRKVRYSRDILDEFTLTFDRESMRDRWIWSALGIHRVPYEFWKVGTWKPAVNARSTDSHFLPRLGLAALRVLSSRPYWNSLQSSNYDPVISENTLCHFRWCFQYWFSPWKYFAHV